MEIKANGARISSIEGWYIISSNGETRMWLSGFNPQAIQDLEGARRAILKSLDDNLTSMKDGVRKGVEESKIAKRGEQ